MSLDAGTLAELANLAMDAARRASKIIASHAGKDITVQHKQGGNTLASQVVTEVDVKAEQAILNVLLPTCHDYDLAMLTEETEDDGSRLEKDYSWCIDPMDGTLSFTEGVPGYAVSIALVSRDGVPVIGVVVDPITGTEYCAVQGQGVTRNGKPWQVTNKQADTLTLVCDRGFTGKPYYPELLEALEAIVTRHGYAGLEVLEQNGAVLNAIHVLEHPPAIYFKCPKPEQGGGSSWDFAATAAIFNELGFSATDFHGNALQLNRAGSTFMNTEGVLFAMDEELAVAVQELVSICR